MACYVLLAFNDDEDAKQFVWDVVKYKMVLDTQGAYENYPLYGLDCEARAVYKKPVKFCNCHRTSGWTRGKRFGWWVCADCGLPHESWASMDSWEDTLGINLLPPEISNEFRHKGWERSTETWDFLIENIAPEGPTDPQPLNDEMGFVPDD